jgi:transposase-like protein
MKGHGAKYERKKEEAIAALLTQKNIEEAARSIGIGHATLLRWLKEPEFDTAIGKPVGLHSASQSRVFSRPLAQPLLPF